MWSMNLAIFNSTSRSSGIGCVCRRSISSPGLKSDGDESVDQWRAELQHEWGHLWTG